MKSLYGLLLLAVVVCTVCAPVLSATTGVNPLGALLEALAKADGLHIAARMRLLNATTGAIKTATTYEYWERGGRFRIQLGSGSGFPWADIAFDGTFMQGKPSPDTGEGRRGGDRQIPLSDAPLALALAPLRLNDPATCPLCQIRLSDLGEVVRQRRSARSALAQPEGAIRQGAYDAGLGRLGRWTRRAG